MKLEKFVFHPSSAWGSMSHGMEETTQLSADLLTSSEEYTGTYPNRSMPTPPPAFRESQGTHIKFSGIINPDLQKTLTMTSRYFPPPPFPYDNAEHFQREKRHRMKKVSVR